MKKIFTFAAAVLCSIGMWADLVVPTATLTLPDFPETGWSETLKPNVIDTTDNWYILSPFEIYKSGFAWSAKKGNGGSSTNSFTATDIFPAYSRWSPVSDNKIAHASVKEGDGNKEFYNYRVTNCEEVAILGASGSNNKRTVFMKIYELTDGTPAEAYTDSVGFEANSITAVHSIPLSASKEYLIHVSQKGSGSGGSSSGNSNFYAIAFKSAEVTPSTDPVGEITIAGPTEGYVGSSVSLKATFDAKPDTIYWTVDGAVQDSHTATLNLELTAERTYQVACWARNQYNADQWILANHNVVATAAPITDTYIWKKGSGYTGCVDNPNVDANANKADTELEHSTSTINGMSAMGRASEAGTEVSIVFTAKVGYYISSICTYGKLEESAGAQISWDGTNWENLAAYSEGQLTFNAPNNTTPYSFTIKFVSASTSTGGLWWRNALITFGEKPAAVISYDANGGTGTMEATSTTVAECTFTAPEGKEFDIWNTAADGSGVDHIAGDILYDNTTLYAIWRNSGAQNSDTTLSALAVAGYTLTPAFAANVFEYSITIPYSAANPEASAVTATPNDSKAQGAAVVVNENAIVVTVTAEDGSTGVYTINILKDAAKKDLLEAVFSNGVHGFIANGNINVPYLQGEAQPTFTAAKFWNADGEPTAAIVDGKLVVTGADSKTAEYTIAYIPVAPMVASYDSITFDTVPNYVYSVYGWDAEKGVKFSKDVEEASNHRISEGKDRIYIALPAAKEVHLISGSGAERPVYILVNNDTCSVKKTAQKGASIVIPLSADHANFIAIESNGNNGDAGFIKMLLVEAGDTPEPTLYTVTIAELTNGTIEFANLGNEDHKFYQGDTVRLIITPADGYELVSANAGNEALIPDEDGNCAFEMPAQDVTVTATFKAVTPQPTLYTVMLGTYEHGTVAFIEPNEDNKYEAGDEVHLTITPDEGYELETISLEGINLAIPVVDGIATFTMPAQDVVVLATFKAAGEGFEYIDASTKAVKFFDNGKLLIKRGDKVFDAKGQIVE